jgi:hypothetical protein
MDAVVDESVVMLAAIIVDSDDVLALRSAVATVSVEPSAEITVCTEPMDFVVTEMMELMDSPRAVALDAKSV